MSQNNATNPGCVDPASQSYPAPPAQQSRPSPQGLAATSSGEIQPRCPADLLSTPAAAGGSGAVTQSSGEQQHVDLRPADPSVTTSRGLPANLTAGTPATRGLPTDVVIK